MPDVDETIVVIREEADEIVVEGVGIAGPPGPPGDDGEDGGEWGSIVGDLSDQTDLATALDIEAAARVAHEEDTADAHGASAVSYEPDGDITATDVQEAVQQAAALASGSGGAWGTITGTLSSQTDLNSALVAKETPAGAQAKVDTEAAIARNADNLTSGTVADARVAATIARDSEVTAAVAAESTLARNADNLTSGTVADARIASTIARDAEVAAAVAVEAGDRATADALLIPLTQKAAAGGVASLDGGGKVPITQLPNSIMEYQGTWNATTNSPTLVDGSGNTGDVYRVTVAGTRNLGSGAITFGVGDYAVYNAAGVWEKSDTTDSVPTVFGRTGDVTAQSGDYSAFYDALGDAAAAQAAAQATSQPVDSDLTAIAALTTTSFGRSFLDRADAAAGRTLLGLGTAATQASTAFDATGAAAAAQAASQPSDADLTAIAALATTSFGRSLLTLADAAAGRTALGLGDVATFSVSDFLLAGNNLEDLSDLAIARFNLGLGSAAEADTGDFDAAGSASAAAAASQPVDSDLTAIAALTTTSFGRSFLDRANAAAGRTLLGLGTAATVDTGTGAANVPTITQADARYQASDSDLTAIAALTTTSFGRSFLDRADAAAGRILLGLGTAAMSASSAFIAASLVDAAGDLITATADDTPSRLAKGAAKQVLRVNAAGNALEYADPRSLVVAEAHASTTFDTSTADNAVTTLSLPGGVVVAGDVLHFRAGGSLLANTGSNLTVTFKFKIGATTVANTGGITYATGALSRLWFLDLVVDVESVTAQRVGGSLMVGTGAANGFASLATGPSGIVDAAAAEDLSSAKNFIASVTLGTSSASASVTCRAASLVLVRV